MNRKSTEIVQVYPDASNVRRVVERAFHDYTGSIGVRLWDGIPLSLGREEPVATVVVHSATPVRELLWQLDPLRLAEAYFLGEIDVEGDLDALLAQRTHLQSLTLSVRDRLLLLTAVLFSGRNADILPLDKVPIRWSKPVQLRKSSKHSKTHNKAAIAFHYDVSNAFYRLWLDEKMIYSCAYFNDRDESLNQAQRNKLDHICHKLRLKPGERFLDIGCGWGALICWAAQNYGVSAHGITLSRQQYEYAQSRIRELGIESQVTVELRDYRDLPTDGSYDKVSSVGMFEHVGLKNLPVYFQIVSGMLKPHGLFLNHGITKEGEGWQKTIGTKFIQRYVFPDGELDSVSNVQREMERTGFEIADVEALRHHYALTLRHWVSSLEARHEDALAHVSEAQYRVWRLYMTACASQFERGAIGVYQILAVNRCDGFADLPLTRGDLYR